MAEIFGILIPFSIPFLVSQMLATVIAFVAIVVVDNYIAHNIELKRTAALSIVALFIVPIVIAVTGIRIPFVGVYAPLVAWLILGELILDNDFSTKIKVLGIAFFVYYVVNIAIQPFILGLV
jgi:hypothetical protein